jgi:hypothetical protein
MTPSQKKAMAVFEALKSSIDSGLNANLTPEDCQILVETLKYYIRSTALLRQKPPRRKTTISDFLDPLEDIISRIENSIFSDLLRRK